MRSLLPFLVLALPSVAAAQEAQYRHFKLSDGREFDAIVESTEATGFKVRVPQGETDVSFAQLFDMAPISKAQYDAQPDWVVYLAAPEERRKGLASAFHAIPHVAVYGDDASTSTRLTPDQVTVASGCGTDAESSARRPPMRRGCGSSPCRSRAPTSSWRPRRTRAGRCTTRSTPR